MTTEKNPVYRRVLRTTIEFTTPFLVGAGREGDIADAVFVADANGLPAIPGSSMAGVLRAAYQTRYGMPDTEALFGFQKSNEGRGSRIAISWACIHDSKDRPVEGIVDGKRLHDAVLTSARSPVIRDHVRINHLGASDAAERSKFDEQAVCRGHRFTFEVELADGEAMDKAWERLINLLQSPFLRLGGKTRRGFGAFKIVRMKAKEFNLSDAKDFEAYVQHPASLAGDSCALEDIPSIADAREDPAEDPNNLQIGLSLQPKGYWMFGGGHDPEGVPGDADMAPFRDMCVIWDNEAKEEKGRVVNDVLVVPATGLKGALAHRVAFHFNALAGNFADDHDLRELTAENNPAVKALFGYVKNSQSDEDGAGGQKGRVIIDDIYLIDQDKAVEPPSQLVHHVGIDRFTGGARDKVLFSERPLWQGSKLDLSLMVLDINGIEDDRILNAFKLTLKDLANGRLQIGAGSGRGNGYFTGTCTWPQAMSDERTTP